MLVVTDRKTNHLGMFVLLYLFMQIEKPTTYIYSLFFAINHLYLFVQIKDFLKNLNISTKMSITVT